MFALGLLITTMAPLERPFCSRAEMANTQSSPIMMSSQTMTVITFASWEPYSLDHRSDYLLQFLSLLMISSPLSPMERACVYVAFPQKTIDQTVQLELVSLVPGLTCQDPKKQRNKQLACGRYKHLFFQESVQQGVWWTERRRSLRHVMGMGNGTK